MKNLFLILFVIGLSLPVFGQRSSEATFYKSLSTSRGVHSSVKLASAGIYNNFTIRDSLLYFTSRLEKAVLQGKPAGTIKPELVKYAQKKSPGSSYRAVSTRLKIYATESKNQRRR